MVDVPRLDVVARPLRNLLRRGARWLWLGGGVLVVQTGLLRVSSGSSSVACSVAYLYSSFYELGWGEKEQGAASVVRASLWSLWGLLRWSPKRIRRATYATCAT